jgi:pimeloyl-ACP methyl ester carboxylesterase
LTIWGDSDVRGDPVLRDRASAALGGLTITMQGTGHLAQLEQPEEFNVAVHAFLGSVLGPGASTT